MLVMALSITTPIFGWCAASAITFQRASVGTQNTFSAVYSSLSSSKPSPSSTSSLYLLSNLSDMYFRKTKPKTTFRYSLASRFPLNLIAAAQILSSIDNSAVDSFFFAIYQLFFLQKKGPSRHPLKADQSPFRCERVSLVLFFQFYVNSPNSFGN